MEKTEVVAKDNVVVGDANVVEMLVCWLVDFSHLLPPFLFVLRKVESMF